MRRSGVRIMAAGLMLTAMGLVSNCPAAPQVWLTCPDGPERLSLQPATYARSQTAPSQLHINIDTNRTYQTMDGFGFTLTGGSAQHLVRMSAGPRTAVIRELFDHSGTNIGVSYLRLSIGASDLNERVFSYNDLPPGQMDPELERFDLGPDRQDVLPVLKEILKVYPELKLMGSPWSPPAWMKTNKDTRGGKLLPEFYAVYAQYFVKYIQAMAAEGIRIDSITVQNEPLHPGNNPSLLMLAEEQAEFIAKHLGPAFRRAGIKTKIIIYDHNADRPDYPISILNNPAARDFIDGSAFHLYGGRIEALSDVHRAHPDKHLYFTEQWIGAPGNLKGDLAWHTRHLIVGAPRNWCRTVLEWNLAADPRNQPHTDRGGCDRCLGAITINGNDVTRNPAYYIIAHASKIVRPGSVRVDSTELKDLPNVAFRTPSGGTALIVLNPLASQRTVSVTAGTSGFRFELPAGSVATCAW